MPRRNPRDLVQVRYEMLRRVRVEGHSIKDTAAAFGLSRQEFRKNAKATPRTPGDERAGSSVSASTKTSVRDGSARRRCGGHEAIVVGEGVEPRRAALRASGEAPAEAAREAQDSVCPERHV